MKMKEDEATTLDLPFAEGVDIGPTAGEVRHIENPGEHGLAVLWQGSVKRSVERRQPGELTPEVSPTLAALVRRLVRTARSELAATESINAVMEGVRRAVDICDVVISDGLTTRAHATPFNVFTSCCAEAPAAPAPHVPRVAERAAGGGEIGREKESNR